MRISLRGARADRGLNQTQVASALGISIATYGEIERNPGRITWDQARELSQLFKRPIEDFAFYGEEAPDDPDA